MTGAGGPELENMTEGEEGDCGLYLGASFHLGFR